MTFQWNFRPKNIQLRHTNKLRAHGVSKSFSQNSMKFWGDVISKSSCPQQHFSLAFRLQVRNVAQIYHKKNHVHHAIISWEKRKSQFPQFFTLYFLFNLLSAVVVPFAIWPHDSKYGTNLSLKKSRAPRYNSSKSDHIVSMYCFGVSIWLKSHDRSSISGKISKFIVHFLLLFHLSGLSCAPLQIFFWILHLNQNVSPKKSILYFLKSDFWQHPWSNIGLLCKSMTNCRIIFEIAWLDAMKYWNLLSSIVEMGEIF